MWVFDEPTVTHGYTGGWIKKAFGAQTPSCCEVYDLHERYARHSSHDVRHARYRCTLVVR